MATSKSAVVLRTAHPGDTFVVDDKLTVTAEGTEIPKTRVEDVLSAAMSAGVQLYRTDPDAGPSEDENAAVAQYLERAGFEPEDAPKVGPTPAEQNQGGGN